jgi:hypothetical protein
MAYVGWGWCAIAFGREIAGGEAFWGRVEPSMRFAGFMMQGLLDTLPGFRREICWINIYVFLARRVEANRFSQTCQLLVVART